MSENIYDTIIIGSGPAGLTAAIYNIRANLRTIVLGGDQPGGQLTLTTVVENYPGFATGIGGLKLMMDMQTQVKNLGVEIRNAKVMGISKFKIQNSKFKIELEDGRVLETKAVIVTTGAKARWLNLPKEKELIGKGVSACATCDGMFFRDKTVVVVGGGDVACEDAMFLSKFASKVYLIHRRDTLRAQVYIREKIKLNPKIEFVWDTEVININSKNESQNSKLEDIKIKNNKTGEEKVMQIDGLFVAIGHDPATSFVKDLVELKETGHVIVGKSEKYPTMTSVPGVFAAGDNVDDVYRQAIIAAGHGAMAGMDAERWLGENKS
ncbi:thioredoxin-disulfide reductase [Candidatus Shapirobacteria bacterium]|nr:thioredoxin-disulfide reductase [Candidatus Shapirobacteria bacterium]